MNKVLSVFAVVAILGVSFYAGHKSFGSSLEYEHADVIDLYTNKCTDTQFIGGCKDCTKCGQPVKTNYKAGGCSYFKDTFCTLCTTIRHCDQENTWCTNKSDHYCDKCQPGFFGDQCKPCTECSKTEYVHQKCITQEAAKGPDSDTVCRKCTQCTLEEQGGKRSFLTKPCSVGGNGVTSNPGDEVSVPKKKKNSECAPCRVCLDGFEYTTRTCESPVQLGFFKDPKNTGPNKVPQKQKEIQIEADRVEAIQKYQPPEGGAKKMPLDTACAPCTGCLNSKHPRFAENVAKASKVYPRGRGLQLWAKDVCTNKPDPATNLYKPTYKGAQKCTACKKCGAKQFIKQPCDPGHPHKEWRCKTFKQVEGKGQVQLAGQTEQCQVKYDAKDKKPKVAKGEMFVNEIPAEAGSDTICQDCTAKPADHWTVFPCNPKHTSDAVHQKCSECLPGEYEFQKCMPFSDTICPSCPSAREKLYKNSKEFKSGLQYCKIDPVTGLPKTQCSATLTVDGVNMPKSTRCGHWLGAEEGRPFKWTHKDKVGHKLPRDPDRCVPWTRGGKFGQCGKWKSECEDGFFGMSCCYHKHAYGCGVLTTRERSAKRMGYPTGDARLSPTNQERNNPANGIPPSYFAEFCMSLCSEFPDCLAVEIQDGGTFEQPAGTPDEARQTKKCFFKSAFTQDQRFRWKGAYEEEVTVDGVKVTVKREGDPNLDCYSNTCRQNIYTTVGSGEDSKPLRIINYKIPPKAKSLYRIASEKANAKCEKTCQAEKERLEALVPKGTLPADCQTKCVKKEMLHGGRLHRGGKETEFTKSNLQQMAETSGLIKTQKTGI